MDLGWLSMIFGGFLVEFWLNLVEFLVSILVDFGVEKCSSWMCCTRCQPHFPVHVSTGISKCLPALPPSCPARGFTGKELQKNQSKRKMAKICSQSLIVDFLGSFGGLFGPESQQDLHKSSC